MDIILLAKLLCLLALANGAPVFATKFCAARWAYPIDGNRFFFDGKPLFGKSKTYRGLISALLATALAAPLLGFTFAFGAAFALLAMLGDLLSSFIKRRLGRPSSSMFLGLDQVPESLLPLLLLNGVLHLSAFDMAVVVAVFLVGELVLSRLLYRLHVRAQPY